MEGMSRRVPGGEGWGEWIRRVLPVGVPVETRRLLDARWERLDPELRRWNQALGKQVVDCAFTLGPTYCSFSCSHCYLPSRANAMPAPGLEEMLEQIRVCREAVGPGGSIQITGGDVVDAYLRAGRFEDLVRVVAAAGAARLTPMVMTHGQALLDDPALLETLVREGGLRKIAFHVDTTQRGPSPSRRGVLGEETLHPLRQRIVDLLLETRERTRLPISAALTATVTERNISSIGSIARWLSEDHRRSSVIHMLSFQPEAAVGRTRPSTRPPTAEETWRQLDEAWGGVLPAEGLLFGDPECSRVVPLLLLHGAGRAIPLIADDEPSRRFWPLILDHVGGAKGEAGSGRRSAMRKGSQLLAHPVVLGKSLSFALGLLRAHRVRGAFLRDLARGRARVIGVVVHDFIDQSRLRGPLDPGVARRLRNCALRGPVRRGDGWEMQPMCWINAVTRAERWASDRETKSADTARTATRRAGRGRSASGRRGPG